MKRFHVHVAVSNLAESTRFYSAMFGAEPSVLKTDYAKWMLDDPLINFAISERGGATGVNHLGFQVESDAELEEVHARLQTAGTNIEAEKAANCCYATSDKYWVNDPAGIAWESFRSLDRIPFYGEDNHEAKQESVATDSGGCGISCCPTPAIIATVAEVNATAKSCCNG